MLASDTRQWFMPKLPVETDNACVAISTGTCALAHPGVPLWSDRLHPCHFCHHHSHPHGSVSMMSLQLRTLQKPFLVSAPQHPQSCRLAVTCCVQWVFRPPLPACCNCTQQLHHPGNTGVVCRYDFPCRLEACQSIISLIQQHSDKDIVLGIDSLGKGEPFLQTIDLQNLSHECLCDANSIFIACQVQALAHMLD